MQGKIFFIVFLVLDTIAGVFLPLEWALLASIPLIFVAWWIAYRSGIGR